MTSKHTPGPWFYAWVGENGDHFLHISSPTGEICDLPMFRYGDLPPSMVNATREANARLIASAPELLEALKAVSNAANVCAAKDEANANYWFAIQRQVNQAIAKAEGRE